MCKVSEDQVKAMEYLQEYNSLFNKMAKQSFEKMIASLDDPQLSMPDSEKILSVLSQGVNLDPAVYVQEHMSYMEKHAQLLQAATQSMSENNLEEIADLANKDRRFKDDDWFTNPFFNYVRQSYLINADFFTKVVDHLEFSDPKAKKQANFLSRQELVRWQPSPNFPGRQLGIRIELCRKLGKLIFLGTSD